MLAGRFCLLEKQDWGINDSILKYGLRSHRIRWYVYGVTIPHQNTMYSSEGITWSQRYWNDIGEAAVPSEQVISQFYEQCICVERSFLQATNAICCYISILVIPLCLIVIFGPIRWIPNDNIEALFWGSQILSTSIQQKIKNVQNEYTIIIAESRLDRKSVV
mgnify:CR=1 FL=1